MSKMFYTNLEGIQFELDIPDEPQQPLDATGALATLLAVEQVVSIEDAANAVGLSEQDLVNEALAWGAAS